MRHASHPRRPGDRPGDAGGRAMRMRTVKIGHTFHERSGSHPRVFLQFLVEANDNQA
jgi:hypothetical protein